MTKFLHVFFYFFLFLSVKMTPKVGSLKAKKNEKKNFLFQKTQNKNLQKHSAPLPDVRRSDSTGKKTYQCTFFFGTFFVTRKRNESPLVCQRDNTRLSNENPQALWTHFNSAVTKLIHRLQDPKNEQRTLRNQKTNRFRHFKINGV